MVNHSYDSFNRLFSSMVGTTTITYAYNAQGIRTSRQVGSTYTDYLLDGGNVVGEITDETVTTYLRGANLISDGTNYYLYNAHGDVVQLTDSTGTVTKTYGYDAFGNERNPDEDDTNPFRYCGEYFDTATGLYYLRARYYDPTVGRFTQEDTHWNTANMIYGDNPQKINEREDALGLKTHSYTPQILSIMQAGNLYVYGVSNPIMFVDSNGNSIRFSNEFCQISLSEDRYAVIVIINSSLEEGQNDPDYGYYKGGYVQDGKNYGHGYFSFFDGPSLDRGLMLFDGETGIGKVGGKYRYAEWSVSVVTANAAAGLSLDFLGINAGGRLIGFEIGIKIPLFITGKMLYIGIEGELFALGFRSYIHEGKLNIGASAIVGASVVFGLVDE